MYISVVAAIGEKNEIGKNGDLLCHLPGDLPFFKKITMGKPVIMGRKTFLSLPKALPGRLNIVLTHDKNFSAPDTVTADSIDTALCIAKENNPEEIFIIGGGSVYSAFLPLADRLYLTEAHFTDPDADTFFPSFDKSLYTRSVIDTYDGVPGYEHALYVRKLARSRDNVECRMHNA